MKITGEELDNGDFTKSDAEEQKRSLSSRPKVSFRTAKQVIEITKSEFEAVISSLVAQAEMLCEATLEESGIPVHDIRGVFLAGGSTRVPLVRDSVKRVFGSEPISTINVDEVVALGAALYAAYKSDRSTLSPIQRKSIEKIKVKESTSKCFGTISAGMDNNRNRYELVNNILIEKGTAIPCSVTSSFYTMHDGQEAVNCSVTELTSPEKDPRFVKTIWTGDLELPSGRPANQEIRVTFSYDENQIMSCSFVDVGTGRKKKIDLSLKDAQAADLQEIDKFLVE